jgi:diketogulonate reductase-like aldo/keto reductase
MKTRAHLHDNLGAAALQISAQQISRINDLAAQVQGERHPPAMMKILDRYARPAGFVPVGQGC